MILKGILDRSLSSQLCIRGFAPIKELARISKADYSYQRNPIYLQEKVIQTFLDEEEYLFFPEVILSFQVKHNISTSKARMDLSPLQILETEKRFTSNVDKSKFKVTGTDIKIIELTLDDAELKKEIRVGEHPFHRVDGNHRLEAAEKTTSEKVNRMVIPFCIILSETIINEITNPDCTKSKQEDIRGAKFEKVVFHNINTKTIPLTSEENLKVILDDNKNFPDSEIKSRFGEEYLITRKVYKDMPSNISEVYPNLGSVFGENPRTFSNEIVKLLKDKNEGGKSDITPKKIKEALKAVNQLFGNYPKLSNLQCIGLIECAIYLQVLGKNLNVFIHWVIENNIASISEISASSLIDIYEKIRESKSKQIFVSMQFDEGHSYKIDDKILELINKSGLLIADLTTGNKNVYHELGYVMGLNQGREKPQNNFILLEQTTPDMKESDIGFNIRAFQQLRFSDSLKLKNELIDALKEYYKLS